jgi:hypothetical protein
MQGHYPVSYRLSLVEIVGDVNRCNLGTLDEIAQLRRHLSPHRGI